MPGSHHIERKDAVKIPVILPPRAPCASTVLRELQHARATGGDALEMDEEDAIYEVRLQTKEELLEISRSIQFEECGMEPEQLGHESDLDFKLRYLKWKKKIAHVVIKQRKDDMHRYKLDLMKKEHEWKLTLEQHRRSAREDYVKAHREARLAKYRKKIGACFHEEKKLRVTRLHGEAQARQHVVERSKKILNTTLGKWEAMRASIMARAPANWEEMVERTKAVAANGGETASFHDSLAAEMEAKDCQVETVPTRFSAESFPVDTKEISFKITGGYVGEKIVDCKNVGSHIPVKLR